MHWLENVFTIYYCCICEQSVSEVVAKQGLSISRIDERIF